MVVNYNKLFDDGKYQNITIDQGVQGDAFAMPTLDDFKMKLLKSESYVILYDFHSLPINLGVSQGGSSPPQLVKMRRHATQPIDTTPHFKKYTRPCQIPFEPEEFGDAFGKSGKDCESSVRIYDGNGELNGSYRDRNGASKDFSFKVYASDMLFKRRTAQLSNSHPVRKNASSTFGLNQVITSWRRSLQFVGAMDPRTDISIFRNSPNRDSDAYKKYGQSETRRITFNMNDARFSTVESKQTNMVRFQLSEGLATKGYPAFTGPILWKVIYGTGPTFGAGTINDKGMLLEGRNMIVGGSYAMIKKSDYDALIKTRRDLGLSIERFKKSGLFTEFEVEYDLPDLWECKFKLTKNNGARIHDGRFDVTDKDIQAIPSSYDTIPSTAFYKYPKDSDIVSLGGGKYGTATSSRIPDTLTRIVTGDADFVELPDRGKTVYWQHYYKFNGNGAFAGVDPDNVEKFWNTGGTETYQTTTGTERFDYGKYVSKIPKLYYQASKSPNESIYFKNPSFPRPVQANGVQFVFNPKQQSDGVGEVTAINYIDPNFATSSFFGRPKKKGVVKFSTYDVGEFTFEIVEANRISTGNAKNEQFKAYKLLSAGVNQQQRGLKSDFDTALERWSNNKYSQKITFTDKTGKPDKLVLNQANIQNIPGVINDFTSQWSQDYSFEATSSDLDNSRGQLAAQGSTNISTDINNEWYDRYGNLLGVPRQYNEIALGNDYFPNNSRREYELIEYEVKAPYASQAGLPYGSSNIRVNGPNHSFFYEVRYKVEGVLSKKVELKNSGGSATKRNSYFEKYFTPVAGDSSGGNVSNDPTLPAGQQVPSRLDPTVHDAVPYVEFNEDGTKLLIAQKAIGKWDVRKSERDRDHRKGYLKIIDRVSTEDTDNKVRISFDIDPTGEKSTYEIKFFNDFQITHENDIGLSKGLQDGKFGLSKDGEFIACYFTGGDRNNLDRYPPRLFLYKNKFAERDAREYRSANEGGLFRPPLVQNNVPVNVPLNPNSNEYTYDAQQNLDFLVEERPFDGLSASNPSDELTCIPYWRPEFEYPMAGRSYYLRYPYGNIDQSNTELPRYMNEVRKEYPLAKRAIQSQQMILNYDPYNTSTNNIHNDSEYYQRVAINDDIFFRNGDNEPLTTDRTLSGDFGCISIEMRIDESNPDSLTGLGIEALVLDTATRGGGTYYTSQGYIETRPLETYNSRTVDYNYRPYFSFVGSLRALSTSNDFASQYAEYDTSQSYKVGKFTGQHSRLGARIYDYSDSIETYIVRTKSNTGLSLGVGTHKFINIPYRYPITFLVDDIEGVSIETLKGETFNESEDKESTRTVKDRFGDTDYTETIELRHSYVSDKTGEIKKKDYYSGSLILKITPEYFNNTDNPPIVMVTMRRFVTANGESYDVTPKPVNIHVLQSCQASPYSATILPDGTTMYGTTTTTTTSTTTTLAPGEPSFHFDRFRLNRKDVRFVEQEIEPFNLSYADYTAIAQQYVSPSRPPTYEELKDSYQAGKRYIKQSIDSGPRFSKIKLNDSGNLLIFKNKFIDDRTSLGDLGALKTGIGLQGRTDLSFSYSQLQDAGGGNRQYGLYTDKALKSFAGYDPAKPNDPLPTNAHVFFGRTNDDFDEDDINDFVINDSGSTLLYNPSQGLHDGHLLNAVSDFEFTSTNNSDSLYELFGGGKISAQVNRGNSKYSEKIKKFALSKDNNVLAIIQENGQFLQHASRSTLRGAPFGFSNNKQMYPESGIYPHQKPGSFSNILVFDRTGDNRWYIRNGGTLSTTWEIALGKPDSVAFEAFEDIRINKDGSIIAGLRYENNSSAPSINLSRRTKEATSNDNYDSSKGFYANSNLSVDGGSDFQYKNGFYIDVWKYNAVDKRWDMLGAKNVGGLINELQYFTSGDKHSIQLTSNNGSVINRDYQDINYEINHEGNVLAVTHNDKRNSGGYHFQEIYAYKESTDEWIKTFSRDSRDSLAQTVTRFNIIESSSYEEDLTDNNGNIVYDPNKNFCHLHNRVDINNSGNIVVFSNPGKADENLIYNNEHFDALRVYNEYYNQPCCEAYHGCVEVVYSPDPDMYEANYYNLATEFGEPNFAALGITLEGDAGDATIRSSTFGTDVSLNASGNILAVSQEGLNSKDVAGVDFYDVKVAIDNFTLPVTTTTTTTTTAMPPMPLKYHIPGSGTLFSFSRRFEYQRSLIRDFSMDSSGHHIAVTDPNFPLKGAVPEAYPGRGVIMCRNAAQHSDFISDTAYENLTEGRRRTFANNPPPTSGAYEFTTKTEDPTTSEAIYGLGQVYDVKGEVDPYATRDFNGPNGNYGDLIYDIQASVNPSGTSAVFVYSDTASNAAEYHQFLRVKESYIQVIDLSETRDNVARESSGSAYKLGIPPYTNGDGLLYASGVEEVGNEQVLYYDPSLADNGTLILARYTDYKLTYRIMNSGVSNGTYDFDGELIDELDFNINRSNTMYNRHHSRYLPALNTIYINNSIATKIYPPNAHKLYTDSRGITRDQLRDFEGPLTWSDYTRYDHGPLANNYGYKSDIKTTSISSQGHVVAFLRCKEIGSSASSSIESVFSPPTGINTEAKSGTSAEYRRTADSHYTKALHVRDTSRKLLFVTTIKGIHPGTSFITDIDHVIQASDEVRADKIAIRPQPFELSKDGNSIVVGSGLYRRNDSNQYENSFLMKNPWDDVYDLSKYGFTVVQPPELIDNTINKDGTVIASLWGPQHEEVYEQLSGFKVKGGRYTYNRYGNQVFNKEPDMTSQYGLPRRSYIVQVFTSGEDASSWQRQIRHFNGNRCKHISLTASGDLLAYSMTEDNWHSNYFKEEDFWKRAGSLDTVEDQRMGYINFLEVENIGHEPPT